MKPESLKKTRLDSSPFSQRFITMNVPSVPGIIKIFGSMLQREKFAMGM
jgi:hypothetical protein